MCLRRRDHHRHPAWTRIRTFRLCVYGLDKPRLVCRARWSVRRHGCAAPASLQIAARYRVLQTDLPDPDIQAGVPLGILCRTASRISAGTRRWHAASTGGTGLPMAAMLRCMRSTTACHSAALCCAGSWRAGHWEQVALKAWPAGVSRPSAVALFRGIWACFCKYARSVACSFVDGAWIPIMSWSLMMRARAAMRAMTAGHSAAVCSPGPGRPWHWVQ